MRYFYKDSTYPAAGSVYEYGSQDEFEKFGKSGLVQMTSDDIQKHLNPSSTYQSELAELNRTYQLDVEAFKQAFSLAYLADGASQEVKQAAIRSQYEARKSTHAANIAALKLQYSTGV